MFTNLTVGIVHFSRPFTMSTRTKSVTSNSVPTLGYASDYPGLRGSPYTPSYLIEEREPVRTAVPLNSSLSIAVHLATWICWTLYFLMRLPSYHNSVSYKFWLIYLCEAAYLIPDLQSALELTCSLFGPRDCFVQQQLTLKGPRAPKVDVFVTLGSS